MAFLPLKFAAGIVRDLTQYAATGNWYDCNLVRFRQGMPEKVGGWIKYISSSFLGTCRSIIGWSLLNAQLYIGIGTNLKYYVTNGGVFNDVTPLLQTDSLGSAPFSFQNGSFAMTVTDASLVSLVGDFVTFSGATAAAGLSAAQLNQNFQITSIPTSTTFTVTLPIAATSTTTGGGASVSAAYEIHTGLDTVILGTGWGAGAWSRGSWGSAASVGVSEQLRLWSADNFGQDLITCVRNGGIYHWDGSNPANRMVNLTTLGDGDTPSVATQIMVSPFQQQVVAFGANPIGSGTQDTMMVRWSDSTSYTVWTPAVTNAAGFQRLSGGGTQILAANHTRNETLIFTDLIVYSMQWIGAPYNFGFLPIGNNVTVIAPNASAYLNDIVVWMGRNQFFYYDGRIQPLQCPVSDYVFERLNYQQLYKVFAYTNAEFNEVSWLYPSTTNECDSYVTYNIKEKAWYYGALSRTAWLDLGQTYNPLGAGSDGFLYSHEYGTDDGSTNPPSALDAYIESSPVEAQQEGPGDHYAFITRLLPDITFRNSTASTPQVTMTVKTMDYPGGVDPVQINAPVISASVPITEFTNQAFIRLRGRSAIFRVESDQVGTTWRLGTPRIEYRLDGRR